MNPSDERLLIEAIVRDVAELPDRTSPADWPDAMLVTSDELGGILASRLEQALSTGPAHDAGLIEARGRLSAGIYPNSKLTMVSTADLRRILQAQAGGAR